MTQTSTDLLTVRHAREKLLEAGLPISRSALYRAILWNELPSFRLRRKIWLKQKDLQEFAARARQGDRW